MEAAEPASIGAAAAAGGSRQGHAAAELSARLLPSLSVAGCLQLPLDGGCHLQERYLRPRLPPITVPPEGPLRAPPLNTNNSRL